MTTLLALLLFAAGPQPPDIDMSICTSGQIVKESGGRGSCATDDDVPEAGDFGALALSGDVTSVGLVTTIATGAVTTGKILDGTIAYADANNTATLAGNPAYGDSSVWLATTGLIWEGATSNTSELLVISADQTADHTITLPDETGTACTTGSVCSGYQAGPLTGDVTTSGAAATIAGNAVALTTDTTGPYVASVATTAPLSGGAAGSEGATLTLTIADADDDGSTKGVSTYADTDFDAASGVVTLAADPASLGAITPTSIDAGTGAIQTGGDTEVWYDATGCYLTGWAVSFSGGHWTVGSSPGSGAQFSCSLAVPKTLLGAAVTVRSVLVYFAVTASSAFDELTLYVQDVTAGTFTDIQRQTTDQTSSPYTFTGVPRAMGAGEALVVSGSITITFDAFTFRGVKAIYDTD